MVTVRSRPAPKAPARPATAKRGAAPAMAAAPRDVASWTFLTNHAHILLCVARDPQVRIRDLADQVGITERAVQRILADLEEGGYVTHERDGRRNTYRVRAHLPFRHPLERHRKIALLLAIVLGEGGP